MQTELSSWAWGPVRRVEPASSLWPDLCSPRGPTSLAHIQPSWGEPGALPCCCAAWQQRCRSHRAEFWRSRSPTPLSHEGASPTPPSRPAPQRLRARRPLFPHPPPPPRRCLKLPRQRPPQLKAPPPPVKEPAPMPPPAAPAPAPPPASAAAPTPAASGVRNTTWSPAPAASPASSTWALPPARLLPAPAVGVRLPLPLLALV